MEQLSLAMSSNENSGQCFGHLENVIVIADDIMVVGKQNNHKDHDIALTQLLKTARECNVHLNYDKLQYKQTEVDFFGKTYMIDGRKPSQSKVNAIQEMPLPQSKKQVQSFIGWSTISQSFLPSVRARRTDTVT